MEYRLIKKWGQPTRQYKNYSDGVQIVWIGTKKDCIQKMKDISFNEESEPIYSWEDGEDYITHGDFDLEVKENNK